ncbi:MAG TPA: alcohol dehydrogenase catalytic domain-containing protein [Myxococcota bacterium]|jgi:threonine dehydrogenase-like Zn-dependent dehydrogenase|nr:alcohol dehydrogenase catalytic domain-containing protein [Myxococcota bacterium]
MKAIAYHAPGDFRFESVPDAKLLADTDALVRVTRTAICGSDLHLWHGFPVPDVGFAVGHEFVGVVEDVGSSVRGLRRGDRVLASCTTGCGLCASCRGGLWSGCSVMTAGGAQNVFGFSSALPGGQAEAVRVPFADANLFAIPASLDDEHALFLTDILPTGYMGAEWAEVGPGDTVVVFGCGPVGTFAQRAAQLRGAARVIAVDLDEGRLARARARGCEAVNPGTTDLQAHVLERTGGRGADAVIEAVGRPELVQRAFELARPGGRVAAIGVVLAPFELNYMALFLKNLTFRTGLVNPQRHIPKLLPAIESGRLDPTEIITHRLPLAQGVRGYQVFDTHAEDVLKVVLQP